MKIETLARKMYEAYCDSSEWKTFHGEPCLRWLDLPTFIQKHWAAAAELAKGVVSTSRRVERLRADNTWDEVDFGDLVAGDMFRMFEPDGALTDHQAECKVVSVENPAIKTEPNTPLEHNTALRDVAEYLEETIRLIKNDPILTDLAKERATRKMSLRKDLIRMVLIRMVLDIRSDR